MSATCAIRSLASTTLRNQRCVSGRYGGGHSAIQAICTSGSRARVGGRALSRTVTNNRDAACVALEPVLPWSNLGRSGSPSVRGAWYSVSRRCFSRGRGGGAGGGTKTHFEVLGVVSDATATEVKAAYLELAKIHHPDATIGLSDVNSTRADERDGATGSTADASFKEIVQAYETLKDPARRELYVQSLPRASHGGPVTERTRRETAGEATLRELIEAGNVDAALKHWEAGGSTLQSLLHIIKVCTRKKKIPHDLPALLVALHKADPVDAASVDTTLPMSTEGSPELFVERKTQAYNALIRLADICGTREQLFQVLDHMETYKVHLDVGTLAELSEVFTSGSRRQNPHR